jgi:DNA modification methylase
MLVPPTAVGLKDKDLVGLPWRLAFALQTDGWWLRSDVIWAKQNPMPESCTDRPTKSHEYLFLFAKNGSAPIVWQAKDTREWSAHPDLSERIENTRGELAPRWRGYDYYYDGDAIREPGRSKRTVWSISTTPFLQAHFATFPPALIEPCILAGCPTGGTALDPFGGAGTTGLVADRLGRNAILIELNADYCAMADARLRADLRAVEGKPAVQHDHGPLFAREAAPDWENCHNEANDGDGT